MGICLTTHKINCKSIKIESVGKDHLILYHKKPVAQRGKLPDI